MACMTKRCKCWYFGVFFIFLIALFPVYNYNTLGIRKAVQNKNDAISRYSQNLRRKFEAKMESNSSFLQMSIQEVYQKSLLLNKQYFPSTCCSRNYSKSKAEQVIIDKLSHLEEEVQNKIAVLQNVRDCASARKLVLFPSKDGYGSTVHMLMSALMIAFGTNRTLIFNSQTWRYSKRGWEQYHMPLSTTCTNASGKSHAEWNAMADPEKIDTIDVLYLPRNGHFRGVKVQPLLTLTAIPIDIAKQLVFLHKKPLLWWSAQFVKYVLQYQPWVQYEVTKYIPFTNQRTASVGLHVRRTDKVRREADLFPLALYMEQAEHFFHQIQSNESVVNIATDNLTVFKEAVESYPERTFQNTDYMVKLQSINKRRYNDAALLGIILDIHLLLSSDFVICTLSSNVCQLIYELLQVKHGDATNCLYSLDSEYFFGPRFEPYKIAIENHIPRIKQTKANQHFQELTLKVGDKIQIPRRGRRIKEGFSSGINQRTRLGGIVPSYKVVDLVQIK